MDRVVAYSRTPWRLVGMINEQATLGNQVMGAFIDREAAVRYATARQFRLLTEGDERPAGESRP